MKSLAVKEKMRHFMPHNQFNFEDRTNKMKNFATRNFIIIILTYLINIIKLIRFLRDENFRVVVPD